MEIMDEFDKLFKMSYISSTTSLKEQPKPKIITSKIAEVTKSNAGFKRSFFREKTPSEFVTLPIDILRAIVYNKSGNQKNEGDSNGRRNQYGYGSRNCRGRRR